MPAERTLIANTITAGATVLRDGRRLRIKTVRRRRGEGVEWDVLDRDSGEKSTISVPETEPVTELE